MTNQPLPLPQSPSGFSLKSRLVWISPSLPVRNVKHEDGLLIHLSLRGKKPKSSWEISNQLILGVLSGHDEFLSMHIRIIS